jgi:hypothetical protein
MIVIFQNWSESKFNLFIYFVFAMEFHWEGNSHSIFNVQYSYVTNWATISTLVREVAKFEIANDRVTLFRTIALRLEWIPSLKCWHSKKYLICKINRENWMKKIEQEVHEVLIESRW